MKNLLLAILLTQSTIGMAQNKVIARNLDGVGPGPNARRVLPTAKSRCELHQFNVSEVPLDGGSAYYDSTIEYGKTVSRETLESNAAWYFEHLFTSKAYRLETHKHNYTGYGAYFFCADKNEGVTAVYKVNYRATITVKNNYYKVTLSEFAIENQHTEVSFDFLMNRAKDNDSKAKSILALFHQTNKDELKKIYDTMNKKEALASAGN